MFKPNEGALDRSLRVLLGIVLLPTGLFLLHGWHGNLPGLLLAGFSLLPMLTGLSGFCPLYLPFGFSTLNKQQKTRSGFWSMMAACRSGMQNARSMCGLDSDSLEQAGDHQS
jgi:hypothetical protein